MEKNTSHILDIHTHKSEEASRGRAIINYQLPVGGALCLSSFYSAGIHPWQLTERDAEEQLAYLQKLLVEERLVEVGEAGLDKLMENGMYLSFGEHYPEQTVRTIPVDRMFLETDDSPVDIEEVLHRVARTRGTDVEELRQAIRENIQKVFFRR